MLSDTLSDTKSRYVIDKDTGFPAEWIKTGVYVVWRPYLVDMERDVLHGSELAKTITNKLVANKKHVQARAPQWDEQLRIVEEALCEQRDFQQYDIDNQSDKNELGKLHAPFKKEMVTRVNATLCEIRKVRNELRRLQARKK